MSDASAINQPARMGWYQWVIIALLSLNVISMIANRYSRQSREQIDNRAAAMGRIGMVQRTLLFDARTTTQPTTFDEAQLLAIRKRLEDRPHEKSDVQKAALEAIDTTLAHVREWKSPVSALLTREAVAVLPDGSVESAPR